MVKMDDDGDEPDFRWVRLTINDRANVVPVGPGLIDLDDVVAAEAAGVELEPGEVERAQAQWIKLMQESGVPPHLVHATERTGMIVTETNRHLFTDEELDRWEAAVQDYHDKKASGQLGAETHL